MSFGKKFLICPILPPMSDLTPFYGTIVNALFFTFLYQLRNTTKIIIFFLTFFELLMNG